ncbi:MAG: hypothetical protein HOE61_02175 [Candidatus Marinimicrobia bacterium]|jgi:hypothetical protein|nr:hypothetical protein [Candidatus Neomarinimicrobiota bacterium]
MKRRNIRKYLVLPVSLLLLNAVEDIAIFRLQSVISDPLLLTGAIITLFVIGFSLVGFVISPAIEVMIERSYATGKGLFGPSGSVVMLLVIGGAIYWVYYKIYIEGVSSIARLLPV